MRILFLSALFPSSKATCAGAIDAFHLMREVSKKHDVFLLSFADKSELKAGHLLEGICREVRLFPLKASPYSAVYGFFTVISIFSSLPAIAFMSSSKEFSATLKEWIDKYHFHLVQVEFSQMAHYVEELTGIPSVIDEIDLAYVRRTRYTKNLSFGLKKLILLLDCLKLKRYELKHVKQFRATLVRTEVDRSMLLSELGTIDCRVIPPWVDLPTTNVRPDNEEEGLIFYGAMYRNVNAEAVFFFVNNVMPSLVTERPSIRLHIVGSNPSLRLQRLSSENVNVTGFVDNVADYYSKSVIAIAPLLSGSGIKGKIIQALAYGKPVVTTPIGAEGIPATQEDGMFISRNSEEMTQRILWLLDGKRYRKFQQPAQNFVRRFYDWNAAGETIEDLYTTLDR